MKLNRTHLFIAVSSLSLVVVLIIQVSWILQTAKIKEDFFNEKANMVLSRTADVLSADTVACNNLQSNAGNEKHKIDSLLNHYMALYNFHIGYYYEVKPAAANSTAAGASSLYQPAAYKACLDEKPGKSGIELKLIFPGKKQFIMAEMGATFITSVILILIVLVLFWRTILSLLKEKRISEHTRDFLNNMTHEFKTPLTNIALAGKMIMRDAGTGQEDKIKHYSGIILGENGKLRLQVEQMLSMAALERGEIPLQQTELDVQELILDALKYMSIQIEGRQGALRLSFAPGRHMIRGDKTHLTNTLCNLVDNALKYSPGKPELAISTSGDSRQLTIEIADKGCGIEKEYQEKVFDTFFRIPTGNVHDVKGFGLGLAYVKKIIGLHNGSIALRSEKGKGAAFIITLPYA